MSPAARNLVDSILRKDPEQRLTLADMGKHAWTTGDGRFPPPQDEEVCRCWVVTCARTTQPLCLRPRVCILCVDRVLRPCIETNNPQSDELVYQAVAPAATPPAAVPVPPTSAFALTPPPPNWTTTPSPAPAAHRASACCRRRSHRTISCPPPRGMPRGIRLGGGGSRRPRSLLHPAA